MAGQHRNAFGRLCVDPARLDRRARVDELRALAGRLQACTDRGSAWLGRALGAWLAGDAPSIEHALGIAPPRGCRETAPRIVAALARDALLRRLVARLGSQARAARVLRGTEACPGSCAELVAELHAAGAPRSRRGIVDAVKRARR